MKHIATAMILLPQDIKAHGSKIGSKTLNLIELLNLGLDVPPFLAIPSTAILELYKKPVRLQNVADEIRAALPSDLYAVRSSALVEDGQTESFAGQFHTEIEVAPSKLPQALEKVLQKAQDIGFSKDFSVLIQKYISPDLAGVTFTRNPTGGREMLIEYHRGKGEALVSGQIQPKQLRLYASEPLPSDAPLTENQRALFQKIEAHFQFPQDIEWCLKQGKLYLLQTRPITTLNLEQIEHIKYLESILPKKGPYVFEKNEISEIAPRPKPFIFSLLKKIYSQGGPVDRVYQTHKIHYSDTDFLKLIGNELFVDKSKELHSLLPCYRLSDNRSPQFSFQNRVFVTLKNLWHLSILKGDKKELLIHLKKVLEAEGQFDTLERQIRLFLKDYELIFDVNLLSAKAINKLKTILRREEISVIEALSLPQDLFLEPSIFSIHFSGQGLKGNSLNLEDESGFHLNSTAVQNATALKKWEALSSFKQTYLKPLIAEGQFWQHLREMGRWLTVKSVNELRSQLLKMAKEADFKDPKAIYFASLDELLETSFSEAACQKREGEYSRSIAHNFPPTITSYYVSDETDQHQGLSPGIASGILVTAEELSKFKGKKILYTQNLLPELTRYFDQIEGIVSQTGGLLSHLAIVARERGLPVVIQPNLSVTMGETIEINGATGDIISLSE